MVVILEFKSSKSLGRDKVKWDEIRRWLNFEVRFIKKYNITSFSLAHLMSMHSAHAQSLGHTVVGWLCNLALEFIKMCLSS